MKVYRGANLVRLTPAEITALLPALKEKGFWVKIPGLGKSGSWKTLEVWNADGTQCLGAFGGNRFWVEESALKGVPLPPSVWAPTLRQHTMRQLEQMPGAMPTPSA
jgi:hypothetical protein